MIDDALLLVRQRRTSEAYYLLPGGGVDSGETVGDALIREVAEETGLKCLPIRPIFINDTISPDGLRHLVNITFLVRVVGGELSDRPSDPSIEGIDLVPIASLGELDLRPPMADEIMRAYESGFEVQAQYLGPIWTPEFGTDQ